MSDLRDFAPVQLDDPAPVASAAALSAQIGLVAQRQEELARAVQRLGTSAAEFDQLRGYVEQIGAILANVAKEVAANMAGGVVDLSIGTPTDPPPVAAMEALGLRESELHLLAQRLKGTHEGAAS